MNKKVSKAIKLYKKWLNNPLSLTLDECQILNYVLTLPNLKEGSEDVFSLFKEYGLRTDIGEMTFRGLWVSFYITEQYKYYLKGNYPNPNLLTLIFEWFKQ